MGGGYIGNGVATANLAGRTLTDLILGNDGDLARLPWVHHHSRTWEPEPLRWLAATGVRLAMSHADDVESGEGARGTLEAHSRQDRGDRWMVGQPP